MEVSAKNGQNIVEAFKSLGNEIHDQNRNEYEDIEALKKETILNINSNYVENKKNETKDDDSSGCCIIS